MICTFYTHHCPKGPPTHHLEVSNRHQRIQNKDDNEGDNDGGWGGSSAQDTSRALVIFFPTYLNILMIFKGVNLNDEDDETQCDWVSSSSYNNAHWSEEAMLR